MARRGRTLRGSSIRSVGGDAEIGHRSDNCDFTLHDRDHGAGRFLVDVKLGADRADLGVRAAHDEGALRVLGDAKERLTLEQLDRALLFRKSNPEPGPRIHLDAAAISEREGALFADACRIGRGTVELKACGGDDATDERDTGGNGKPAAAHERLRATPLRTRHLNGGPIWGHSSQRDNLCAGTGACDQVLGTELALSINQGHIVPDFAHLEISAQVLRGLAGPGIKALAAGGIDIARTHVNEPGACLLVDLCVELGSRHPLVHASVLTRCPQGVVGNAAAPWRDISWPWDGTPRVVRRSPRAKSHRGGAGRAPPGLWAGADSA